jgi:hypothetical protein
VDMTELVHSPRAGVFAVLADPTLFAQAFVLYGVQGRKWCFFTLRNSADNKSYVFNRVADAGNASGGFRNLLKALAGVKSARFRRWPPF